MNEIKETETPKETAANAGLEVDEKLMTKNSIPTQTSIQAG
jgi:hypothetical protein